MVAIPDGLWVDNQTDGPEFRKALGSLLVPAGPVDPRSGRFMGPGSPLAVQPTAPASMAVLVKAGKGATFRSSTYGAVIGVGPDGDVTVPIPAAPTSGSRYSLVYEQQRDPLAPANDSASGAIVDVVTGSASSTPLRPSLPAGAELLGEVLVPAGVSTVTSAMIADKPKYTALRGTAVPVATQDERLLLPAYPSAQALELDTGRRLWHDGTRWRYDGDRISVANAAARTAATTFSRYTGLQVREGDTRRTFEWDGTRWLFVGGPTPHIKVRRVGTWTSGTSGWQAFPFTQVINTGTGLEDTTDASMWSAAQPTRLVAPIEGLYLVEASIGYPSGQPGYMGFLRGGDTVSGILRKASTPAVAADHELAASVPVRLAAGQYVDTLIYTAAAVTFPNFPTEQQPGASLTWIGNY